MDRCPAPSGAGSRARAALGKQATSRLLRAPGPAPPRTRAQAGHHFGPWGWGRPGRVCLQGQAEEEFSVTTLEAGPQLAPTTYRKTGTREEARVRQGARTHPRAQDPLARHAPSAVPLGRSPSPSQQTHRATTQSPGDTGPRCPMATQSSHTQHAARVWKHAEHKGAPRRVGKLILMHK